jgi:Cof subfamily protein (haloacid dehalogenase superfamily)
MQQERQQGAGQASPRRYRLVVSDIDGTLLDSTSVLRPRVMEAIAQARRAGLKFTLATGRRFTTTEPIMQRLALAHAEQRPEQAPERHTQIGSRAGLATPVVLQTGALVVSADGSRVYYRHLLPRPDAQYAIQVLVDLGLQPILYEDALAGQRLITGPAEFDSPAATRYLSSNPNQVERVSYEQLARVPEPLQIAVIGDLQPLEAAVPQLKLGHCRTIMSYSGNMNSYFMEVFHRHCNKGAAVARLARMLGISMAEVVCIGDNWNDIEMLAMAGCGIAVANAAPGVPPYARRRTVSNDAEAVAEILSQILAGEEPGEANPDWNPSLPA